MYDYYLEEQVQQVERCRRERQAAINRMAHAMDTTKADTRTHSHKLVQRVLLHITSQIRALRTASGW